MAIIARRLKPRHQLKPQLGIVGLPLFDAVSMTPITHLTPGGAYLVRHRRVKPQLANAIAELAGIGAMDGL